MIEIVNKEDIAKRKEYKRKPETKAKMIRVKKQKKLRIADIAKRVVTIDSLTEMTEGLDDGSGVLRKGILDDDLEVAQGC